MTRPMAPEHDEQTNINERIDGEVADSFPASDPPSWTVSGIGGPQHTEETEPTCDSNLLTAIQRLEIFVAQSITEQSQPWKTHLVEVLEEVQRGFTTHVAEAEQSEGLFSMMDTNRPGMIREADHLREEHAQLISRITQVTSRAREFRTEDSAAHTELREQVRDLLTVLKNHQTRETDLLSDTYNMDIGGLVCPRIIKAISYQQQESGFTSIMRWWPPALSIRNSVSASGRRSPDRHILTAKTGFH